MYLFYYCSNNNNNNTNFNINILNNFIFFIIRFTTHVTGVTLKNGRKRLYRLLEKKRFILIIQSAKF